MTGKKMIVDSDLMKLKELREKSLIGNNDMYADIVSEEKEKYEIKEIVLEDDELFLFKGITKDLDYYKVSALTQISEINRQVFKFLSGLFADVISVNLELNPAKKGWVFVTSFKFLTPDQFKEIKKECDEEVYRAVSSTIDPDNRPTSLAQSMLQVYGNQSMSSSDISKYASITKEAKELLTNIAWFDPRNNKRRWVKDETYTIKQNSQTAYNGRSYNNIIATIYLDSEKVLDLLCTSASEKGSYEYSLCPSSTNITGTDCIMQVDRINKRVKKQLSLKYGIEFSKK